MPSRRRAATDPGAKIEPLRVAAHMSSDTREDYFFDGLADELINILSRVSDLRVAARTSAFTLPIPRRPLRLRYILANRSRSVQQSH